MAGKDWTTSYHGDKKSILLTIQCTKLHYNGLVTSVLYHPTLMWDTAGRNKRTPRLLFSYNSASYLTALTYNIR